MTELEVGRHALRSFKFSANSMFTGSGAFRSQTMSYGEWRKLARRHAYRPRWVSPSYVNNGDWVDGTCVAVCRAYRTPNAAPHEVPCEECTCGIYGSLSYADLLYSFPQQAKVMVAVIAAEGQTIIGDRGLRTAFARVVGFWVDTSWVLDQWKSESQQMPSLVAVPARTAREQFKDAQEFGDPLSLVEAFGLALLPPARDAGKANSSPEYWTAKHEQEQEQGQ